MCGILGIFDQTTEINTPLFKKSLELIKHRGPDNQSTCLITPNLAFGHTRLSIVDLKTDNNQPFIYKSEYFLTFNGEIFNYIELREELIAEGVHFTTDGDTEVVLMAFIQWGKDCVQKFNGMWSFVIYTKSENSLFCSRDRFGIKPFNYYHEKNKFYFSSEIKPLLEYAPEIKKPNFKSIELFLIKGTGAQLEDTWFENIKRILPGHNLLFNLNTGQKEIYRYWNYPTKTSELSFEASKTKFKALFYDAVKLRTRTDVPYSSTITAGLDSNSIVGVINKIKTETLPTYTVYSPSEQFNEKDKLGYSDKNVNLNEKDVVELIKDDLNISATFFELNFENFLQEMHNTIYYLESGNSSPATVSVNQMYKNIKGKHKVLFEGQGADELLAGYVTSIIPFQLMGHLKRLKIISFFKVLKLHSQTYSLKYIINLFVNSIDSKIILYLKKKYLGIDVINKQILVGKKGTKLKFNLNFKDAINEALYKQHSSGLVNLLHYGDALSMANSIETRLPFLDYRLVEFSFSMPSDFKFKDKVGKYIQREALKQEIPAKIYNENIKIGFATPLNHLFKNSKEVDLLFSTEDQFNFFDHKKVNLLLERYKNDKFNYPTILFKILSIKIWFKLFFSEKTA